MNAELKNKMSELMCKLDTFNGDHCIVIQNPNKSDSDFKSIKRKLRFINKKLFK